VIRTLKLLVNIVVFAMSHPAKTGTETRRLQNDSMTCLEDLLHNLFGGPDVIVRCGETPIGMHHCVPTNIHDDCFKLPVSHSCACSFSVALLSADEHRLILGYICGLPAHPTHPKLLDLWCVMGASIMCVTVCQICVYSLACSDSPLSYCYRAHTHYICIILPVCMDVLYV